MIVLAISPCEIWGFAVSAPIPTVYDSPPESRDEADVVESNVNVTVLLHQSVITTVSLFKYDLY